MNSDEMIEKLKKISTSIRSKEYMPFYYLYGNEDYFLTSVKRSILKSFPDDTKLNTKIYNKDNFVLNDVIKYLGNIPFMSDKKLIIFDNIDYFISTREEKDAIDMINAMNSAKDLNVVLFIKFENRDRYVKDYDKNNIFLKYFSENGIAVNTTKLDNEGVVKYVQNHFKKAEVEIDKPSIAYFIMICGGSLSNLFNEADKLIAFVGDKKKITKNDIDEIVTRKIDDKIFTLIDLYNSNRKEDALKFYGDLLTEGEKNSGIFAAFSYNYSNLIVCKDLMQRGKGQKEISDLMGLESWRVGKLMNANKYVNIDTLSDKMKKITDISLARVKGNLDEDYMVLLLMS